MSIAGLRRLLFKNMAVNKCYVIAGLLLAVAMWLHISHQVEAEYGGTSTNQDDAVLVCRLKEDASGKTNQAVAVDYYSLHKSNKKMVFMCFLEDGVCPTYWSDPGFELLGNITSELIARVPAATLQNGGSYMSQFIVQNSSEPRFLCQAITLAPQHRLTSMSTKRATTERKASASFTSDDNGTGADGQYGGLTVVVIILAVALCLALAVILILILQNRARISRGTNSAHSPGSASSQEGYRLAASDNPTAS